MTTASVVKADKFSSAERIHAKSAAEWRRWLYRNAAKSSGVWLVTWKKATGKPRMEYAVAVEEALAVGWIDSLPRSLDEERSLLWFAPRKARTGWSRLNKSRVEKLIAEDRMTPAGMAVVDQAKRDGSWSKLDAVEALVIPDDLACALAAHGNAAAHFAAFPRSATRGILEWIATAKAPQTRAKRIADTAKLAAQNVRANQWRR